MAYITYQQYLDLYGTCPISEEEFPVYAGLASDMIDSITRYRMETVLTGQAGQSFTVGKVSVSGGALSSTTTKPGALMVSPFALSLLEQTPLMERGVHVCSDRFLNPFWGI